MTHIIIVCMAQWRWQDFDSGGATKISELATLSFTSAKYHTNEFRITPCQARQLDMRVCRSEKENSDDFNMYLVPQKYAIERLHKSEHI